MTNSINTNIAAYFAQANVTTASNMAASSVSRLSSGNRIVQASDDVAALAIGTSLATQVSALRTAQTNAAQGNSLLQVADGALAQIQSILQRQKAIALQAGSGALTDTDRGFLNQEFQALSSQLDSLAVGTTFNGVRLIDGSIATGGSNNPLQNDATPTLGSLATVSGETDIGTLITAASMIQATAGTTGLTGTKADTAFVGDLSKGVFSVVLTAVANTYAISYTINGETYSTQAYLTSGAGPILLKNAKDTSANSSAGMISITVAATTNGTYTGAAGGALLQRDLTTFFSTATAYASRHVATALATDSNGKTITGSAIRSVDTAGTLLDGFNGADVTVQSALYDGNHLPPISDFTATGIGTNTIFSVLVNGVKYSMSAAAATGTTVAASDMGGGAGIMVLYKDGDSTSNEKVTLDFVTTTSITNSARIDTAQNVQNFLDALNTVFGSGGNAGGLTFQLGATTDSNVTVNIANVKTSALYSGASLDVSTQGTAATAAASVTTALDTVTAVRSGVGALQSRFSFAAAALQTSVQNQDAARGQLLDTDIATESTSFATQQVKLQAGISVLAQANQQLQALLKLIG